MVKKEKKDLGPRCNQVKFYLVALVLVVAVIAVFSMYLGTTYTGFTLKTPGESCFKDKQCNSGVCLNSHCTGLGLGVKCSSNTDCEIGRCSREDLICGGKFAKCSTDNECLSGDCDSKLRMCRGNLQSGAECSEDVECRAGLKCTTTTYGSYCN
ncbi:hypothetical protein J4436_00515 [Candidatus Woesearchaeota archaeon]|nr:hypothetical protein [Candidatus Woesearchaeota archaeon]